MSRWTSGPVLHISATGSVWNCRRKTTARCSSRKGLPMDTVSSATTRCLHTSARITIIRRPREALHGMIRIWELNGLSPRRFYPQGIKCCPGFLKYQPLVCQNIKKTCSPRPDPRERLLIWFAFPVDYKNFTPSSLNHTTNFSSPSLKEVRGSKPSFSLARVMSAHVAGTSPG